MATRILVVEDDPKLLKLLSSDLELEGYTVLKAADGVTGYELAQDEKPDLILLDVMLPKMTGYDVCRNLRKDGFEAPILMLTAKGQEAEKVVGLNLGADDYITKPFSGLELMARIKAHLRKRERVRPNVEKLNLDGILIDFKGMSAERNGKSLNLTTKEFQLLELLVRHEGEVISREKFLEDIWGYEEMPTTRTVDNQIVSLRQKLSLGLKKPKDYILTVHGAGYKFVR